MPLAWIEFAHLLGDEMTTKNCGHLRLFHVAGLPEGEYMRVDDCPYCRIISGFYEEEIPQFRQGTPTHELEEFVTAADCTAWVGKIVKLKTALEQITLSDDINIARSIAAQELAK